MWAWSNHTRCVTSRNIRLASTVGGGVLDAPCSRYCRVGLDAQVRLDRFYPRHQRRARLASTAQRMQIPRAQPAHHLCGMREQHPLPNTPQLSSRSNPKGAASSTPLASGTGRCRLYAETFPIYRRDGLPRPPTLLLCPFATRITAKSAPKGSAFAHSSILKLKSPCSTCLSRAELMALSMNFSYFTK